MINQRIGGSGPLGSGCGGRGPGGGTGRCRTGSSPPPGPGAPRASASADRLVQPQLGALAVRRVERRVAQRPPQLRLLLQPVAAVDARAWPACAPGWPAPRRTAGPRSAASPPSAQRTAIALSVSHARPVIAVAHPRPQRHQQVLVRGDQVAPGQRDHARAACPPNGGPAPPAGPPPPDGPRPAGPPPPPARPAARAARPGCNTANSASPTTSCPCAQSITSRQTRSASTNWPMSTSGAARPASTRASRPGVAGLPGGRLGPLRVAQLLGELAVRAGVQRVHVVRRRQLRLRDPPRRSRRSARTAGTATAAPPGPAHARATTGPGHRPDAGPARALPPVAHHRSAARSSSASGSRA